MSAAANSAKPAGAKKPTTKRSSSKALQRTLQYLQYMQGSQVSLLQENIFSDIQFFITNFNLFISHREEHLVIHQPAPQRPTKAVILPLARFDSSENIFVFYILLSRCQLLQALQSQQRQRSLFLSAAAAR